LAIVTNFERYLLPGKERSVEQTAPSPCLRVR
jgi:hypothetical protein